MIINHIHFTHLHLYKLHPLDYSQHDDNSVITTSKMIKIPSKSRNRTQRLKPLKVFIAFTVAFYLKLVHIVGGVEQPTTTEWIKWKLWINSDYLLSVCTCTVQTTANPFICSTHLSLCIFCFCFCFIFHNFSFSSSRLIIFLLLLFHFNVVKTTWLSSIEKTKTKYKSIQCINSVNVCSYPFQRFEALPMAASVAIVHPSAENYSPVHLHDQVLEKQIAMKMFCPTNRWYFVKHPVDVFRYFASLNVPKHHWKEKKI